MRLLVAAILALLAAGCDDSRNHAHAVYMLVDTSGTYAQESAKAQVIVNYLLGTLQPGDSLAVARVESRSFSEKDIVAKATFDARPTQAKACACRAGCTASATMADFCSSTCATITD